MVAFEASLDGFILTQDCFNNLQGVHFFILGLCRRGHGSDLQSAALSLTLLISLSLRKMAAVFQGL
jgi:hypothetical protein